VTTTSAAPATEAVTQRSRGTAARTRGRRQGALLRLRDEVPMWARVVLGVGGVVSVLLLWLVAATVWSTDSFILPTPAETWSAGVELAREGVLWSDLRASTWRVVQGYGISMAIGIVLGIGIGSFRSIEAFSEAPIGFLRYIPATALTPLFLIWLGIDAAPKIALIVAGTVFYNVLMVADVARAVPRELISSSYTLGASRLRVLGRVILPHSWPGIIDVARINLAAAWLMLVVAELLAGESGLAFRISKAYRFRQVDRMFALLLVLAVIGVTSDLLLRWLRNRTSPWARA
jgi:NitT/TauT family transport system permease protein